VYLPSAAPAGLQLQYQEEKDCVAVSFQPVQYKVPVSYVVQVATVEGKMGNGAGLAYSTVRVLFASPSSIDPQGVMQALLLCPLRYPCRSTKAKSSVALCRDASILHTPCTSECKQQVR